MTPAATIAVASPWGWVALVASLAVAAAAGVWYWRDSGARDPRLRVALVALRVAAIAAIGIAVADPTVTREVGRLPRLEIVWDEAARLDVADASGGTTRREHLAAALAAARDAGLDDRYEVVDADDVRADATLLMTDGTGGPETAGALDGRVVAVVPARAADVPDLAVVSVAVAPHGAAGAPRALVETLACRGAAGRRAVVNVSDGARVLASGDYEIRGDDEVASVELSFVPHAEGRQRLVVEAAGLTGEVETANNRLDTWIVAEPRVCRVLFVESQPTWEGKFVRRALEEDPAFHVDYVARTSKAAAIAQAPDGERETPTPSASVRAAFADAASLFAYDAIVLGPLDAAELGDADVARLATFVDRRGGGLVVLGGNAYGGSVLSSRGALAGLLPAIVPASSLGPAERGREGRDATVAPRPVGGRERHPVFAALGDEPGAAFEKLQRLGDDYLRIGALKPGATALLEDSAAPAAGRPVLLATHEYGAGRVALVAPSDTWRLAVGAPAEAAQSAARLWTSLVAWVSANAQPPVALSAQTGSATAGSSVRVELATRSRTFEPVRAATVRASAVRIDGEAETIPVAFLPVADAPGVAVANVELPSAGAWRVDVDVDGRERASVEIVATEPDPEAARSRRDPVLFERLRSAVEATGGAVVEASAPESIVAAAGEPGRKVVVETSHPARHPAWGGLVLLLAIGEMFLRRWFGVD